MNKRILIIDDRSEVLDIVQEVLMYEGFEVDTAPNAKDVLDLITRRRPDLILIDYSLGDPDGGAVCALIKNSVSSARLPVIIFSAYSDKGLKPGSFGCEDFISKPFNIDELINKVKLHSRSSTLFTKNG
ncbi:response regulator [Mucilaginibacter conchicola]|uniref:Response regulator n=1 Tax=Mucilaginibacter conchicola TaxID=2303333 RepID=A0A372NXG3_9SPHI|nr:response regulator [Mucilaginibacter conchicola]RFZ94813.1 response regulator [Mucilaginibacter conchicola]